MLTVGLYGVEDSENSGVSHDHGVAVMRDGVVLYCQELERHTRRKHDGHLGTHIEELLLPFLCTGKSLRFVLANSFAGCHVRSSSGGIEIEGTPDLEVPDMIAECRGSLRLPYAGHGGAVRFYAVSHEVAHLGTCLPFFGPYEPNSLLIHIDGGASRSCASAWYFDGADLTCLDYGWHAGLKGAVNNFNASQLSRWILGLKESEHLSMPGKLMGLASLGRVDEGALDWLQRNDWLREVALSEQETLHMIQHGLPRLQLSEFSHRDRGSQVLAAGMQRHLESEILQYVERFRKTTGARHLYYSGGAALNIHANTRIENELDFDSLSIPSAPSDAGLALGSAAFLEWREGCRIRKHPVFLNHLQSVSSPVGVAPALRILHSEEEVAGAIEQGKIVGVWIGDAELGPRALGHRSLLARPDSVDLRRKLSETVKQREWYRPVAPMMLEEVAEEALNGYKSGSILARYMLGAWHLRPAWVQAFWGCIHADGTVRAQVVDRESPELAHIHRLLVLLQQRHGIHGVINTSFNRRGKPIVHTLDQAVDSALAMGIDMLWLPAQSSR